MSNRIRVGVLIFSFLFSTVHLRVSFCEEKNIIVDERPLTEVTQEGIEKVMQKIENEKMEREEVIKIDLESKLSVAIENWISLAKRNKNSELNKLVEQQWERLQEHGPRFHYDYYLRGFEYLNLYKDIVKTNSILTPYKGSLNIKEALYVERTPLVNRPRSKYYYTAITPIKVSFEYQQDKWIVIDTAYGQTSLEQRWPEEVVDKMKEKLYW